MTVRSLDVHADALRFVHDTILRQGFPPTVREVGHAVGYSSPSSAAIIVHGLIRRGWLRMAPHRTRTMMITDTGREVLNDA